MTVVTAPAPRDAARDAFVDEMRTALAERRRVRVAGAGAWLDAGRSTATDVTISTRQLRGIVEYVPGDLTLTARAGTSLGEIRDATAAHGQWLALDPHGSDEGTLGATIATASWGPLATAFGTPRDLVLGLEFISGTGALVRGGGRVVKNVAGFDLVRLLTGSWGTLGAITEATVRLHARPQVDQSFAVTGGDDDIERARLLLKRLPFSFHACELVNAPFAAALGLGDSPAVIARVGGNPELVSAARAALRTLGEPREIPSDVWTRLRGAEPSGAAVVRLSHLPTRLEALWRAATRTSDGATFVHATPSRGVVRCIMSSASSESRAHDLIARTSAAVPDVTIVGERLPASAWTRLPSPAMDRLSQGIRGAFDPERLLNHGIFGEQP